MEGAAQVEVSLGRGGGAQGLEGGGGGTAQARWAPEGVVARPPETLMREKPKWRKSNPGREKTRVAPRWWLSRGKSKCVSNVKQDTNAQMGTTTLGGIAGFDPQPYSPRKLTFEAQDTGRCG